MGDEERQSLASRGSAPLVRDTQTPSDPALAQVRHPPVQASLQQYPSAQKPLEQSDAQAQGWPALFWVPEVPEVPQVVPPCPTLAVGRSVAPSASFFAEASCVPPLPLPPSAGRL